MCTVALPALESTCLLGVAYIETSGENCECGYKSHKCTLQEIFSTGRADLVLQVLYEGKRMGNGFRGLSIAEFNLLKSPPCGICMSE